MNRRVVLSSRPAGIPQRENFTIDAQPRPLLAEGEILIRNHYLSVEPAMRGWIVDTGNYAAPVAIGSVMRSLAAGIVEESRHPAWQTGDRVLGWFGWQELSAVTPDAIVRRVVETDLPLSLSLGVLGINGVTATLAFGGIGAPKPGDTVVVSTAAGAVGSVVGQLARASGCNTVGIAGGPTKLALCRDLFGYDIALDRHDPDLPAAIAAACPKGVDIYFDNTAGPISDAVMPHLATGARVIVCGTASVADWAAWPSGPRVERHLLVKRARMQGFVIFDHMDAWDDAVSALAEDVRAGRINYREEILEGLDAAPDAIAGLYRGENYGKRLIRVG